VWEDQSVWNVDFLPVFDNLTAQDLNKLERQFLALLQYNVSLTASLYAKYYFELRTFSKVDSTHFPLQPLDKLNAKRLEVCPFLNPLLFPLPLHPYPSPCTT
jgi:hypothetical protein